MDTLVWAVANDDSLFIALCLDVQHALLVVPYEMPFSNGVEVCTQVKGLMGAKIAGHPRILMCRWAQVLAYVDCSSLVKR